jgi:Tfp pilus assembly protein PilN
VKLGSKVLGLAIGQKSILVAEVSSKGGKQSVTHFGEFVFPEGVSLGHPDKLGPALAQFLKSKHFTTRDAVIGLPAKRLVTRRKEIPAASLAVAASSLRLQAEGEFSSELDNLVMDFAGTPSAAEATTVLLVATNKVIIDECEAMARAAGLKVHGITSTGAALGRATSRLPGGDGWVLSLGSTSAELVVQHGSDPAHLGHLNVMGGAPEAIGVLAGEIRRTMASIPKNGTPATLALWNSGTSEDPRSILAQRLSMPVTAPELRTLVAGDGGAEQFVPAVTLALTAMEPAGLPLDFLHSRLAPPKEPAISTIKLLGIVSGILVLGAIVAGFLFLKGKSDELGTLQEQIKKQSAQVQQATLDKKRYTDAVKWIPKGPHYIAVLKDVTRVFPAQANTIWVQSLQRLPMEGDQWEISGFATDRLWASQVAQNLNDAEDAKGKIFSQAALKILEPDAQQKQLFKYTIRFNYLRAE